MEKKKQPFYKSMLPIGLKKDISEMGYQLQTSKVIMLYLVVAAIGLITGKVYDLGIACSIVLCIGGWLLIPNSIRRHYLRKYYSQKFVDATSYMEQFLYSFRKVSKIYDALKDVYDLFQEGRMHDCLGRAIDHMENAEYSENDLNEETLDMIEKEYSCERIQSMHTFARQVENDGGDYEKSLNILMEDKTNWVNSINVHQQNIMSYRRNIIISILITGILSAVPTMMIAKMLTNGISLGSYPVYTITVTVALLILMKIFAIADKKTTVDWFKPKQNQKINYEERYEKVINFDSKKEAKQSALFAIIPAVLAVICVILKIKLGVIVFVPLTVFMLFQHKIGYKLAYDSVVKKLEIEFPKWLLSIALKLQSDNVINSIERSYEEASPILKPALQKMLKELEEDPTSSEPFMNFLSEFDIKEIKSAMKLLYSMANIDAGDPDTQISEIIVRNNNLMMNAEKLKQDDELAGLFGLMMTPTFSGIMIFCAGLIVFTIGFFAQAASM